MKSRFYIWLSLVAGLLATSCNDAFMDRQPHTEIGGQLFQYGRRFENVLLWLDQHTRL